MVPSIASIPRFTQNPRALPSAFAVLCAKPLGVQLLNCIPLPTFSDTLRYSIKKARSCVYFRPVLPQSASILSLHQRRTHRPEVKASGQCVLPFCYSSFSIYAIKPPKRSKRRCTREHRRTQHRYHPERRWHHLCAGHQRRDGHRERLHHADRHHRCFHRGQLEQLRRLITASFRSRVPAAAKHIQRFI